MEPEADAGPRVSAKAGDGAGTGACDARRRGGRGRAQPPVAAAGDPCGGRLVGGADDRAPAEGAQHRCRPHRSVLCGGAAFTYLLPKSCESFAPRVVSGIAEAERAKPSRRFARGQPSGSTPTLPRVAKGPGSWHRGARRGACGPCGPTPRLLAPRPFGTWPFDVLATKGRGPSTLFIRSHARVMHRLRRLQADGNAPGTPAGAPAGVAVVCCGPPRTRSRDVECLARRRHEGARAGVVCPWITGARTQTSTHRPRHQGAQASEAARPRQRSNRGCRRQISQPASVSISVLYPTPQPAITPQQSVIRSQRCSKAVASACRGTCGLSKLRP